MTRRGTYCDVGVLTTYLAGYGKAPVLAKEESTLLLALESTRERIERYCAWRTFGPVLGTRTFDAYVRPLVQSGGAMSVEGPQGVGGGNGDVTYAGSGFGLTDSVLARGSHWSDWIYPDGPNAGAELNLGTWLAGTPSAVTLTALDGSGSPIALVEGWDKDYTLLPADGLNPPVVAGSDELPAERLRLTPSRAATILGTPFRLAVTGTWGWSDERLPLTSLGADMLLGDTAITVHAGDGPFVFAGQTLWVGTEQVYVRHVPISGANPPVNADAGIVVERGVNGTVAAPHANSTPVSLMRYPPDVEWCALEIARNRFRGRVMGALATFSEGRVMLSETEEVTLKRLDSFLKSKVEAGFVAGFA